MLTSEWRERKVMTGKMRRVLAAFLAMGMLFATPAAAYAEELEIKGGCTMNP